MFNNPNAQSSNNSNVQTCTDAAVQWWSDSLKKYISTIENRKKFESCLKDAIMMKIKDHWYPGTPTKGQGYRSLVMDKQAHCDPVLIKAAASAGLSLPLSQYFKDIESVLMWIDPDSVVVRLSYAPFLNIPPEEKILFNSPLTKHPNTPTKTPSPPYTPYLSRHPSTPPHHSHHHPHHSSLLSPSSSPYLHHHAPNYRSPSNISPYGGSSPYSSPHKGPYNNNSNGSSPTRNGAVYYNNHNSNNSLLLNHPAQYIWYNNKNLGEDNNWNMEKNSLPSGQAVYQNMNMNANNNYFLSKHQPLQNKDILIGPELEVTQA